MAIHYIVNEKERMVIALLKNTKRDAISAANVWTGADNWESKNRIDFVVHADKKYLMPDKFTGIARCDDEDEWNEEIGKQIARNRVLDKYHRSLNKVVRKINNDIQEEAARFNERVSKLRDTK